jgi:hypothetical protein
MKLLIALGVLSLAAALQGCGGGSGSGGNPQKQDFIFIQDVP